MSAVFPWDVLRIEPTGDTTAIRRAYAAVLKETNPEDNPQGFKRLREAYETALEIAVYDMAPDDAEPMAPSPAPIGSAGDEASLDVRPDALDPPERPQGPAMSPEEEAHATLCDGLAEAVRGPAPDDVLLARLAAVLASPALERVEISARTERFLVSLIYDAYPHGTVLIDPILAHFAPGSGGRPRWDVNDGGAAVLARFKADMHADQASEAFLARCADRRHEFFPAFKLLSAPPRGVVAKTLSLRHLRLVARFLAFVQNRHPMAYRRLDPDSVDWWRDRIANFGGVLDWAPRFILAAVVIIVVAVAVVMRDDSRDPAAGPADELSRTFEATDLPRLATLARQAPARPHPAMRLCLARARLAATPEDAALAVTACDAVRTLLPASLRAMRYAGYARLKRLDAGAEALFDEVLRVSPNDAHAQIGKGLARRLAGDEAQALALIGEGAARDPDAVAYFAGFGLPVGAYTLTPSVFSRLEMPPAPQIDAPAKVATPLTQDDFDAALRANGLRAFPDGKVTVACSVSLAGRAEGCRVVEETPLDYGLADVALTIVDKATFTPGARAGVPIDGARVAIPFTFRNAPADVAPPEKTPT